MNPPTITSSMISRRMALSGRLNTFSRSLRPDNPDQPASLADHREPLTL